MGEEKSRPTRARLPPLGALRCFEAAARLQSFTRAAQELHLTHGAISRAVRSIEDALGVALFERRHQRVRLTAAGARLREAAANAFDGLEAAVRELRAAAGPRPLRLSCEPTLMMRWLIPRLAGFHAQHPQIALQLVAGGGPVPFGEVDLAIRRNDFDRDGAHAEFLFEERIGPVCSPRTRGQWLTAAARPRLRAEACLLHTATRPGAWNDWARASGATLPQRRGQRFEHFYFSLQAAVAGLGVAIGPWQAVRDDIDAGLLEAPLGFVADGSRYELLSPQAPMAGTPEAAVLDWLRAQA